MTTRNLLCYARGVEDDWEAICVDFDIAVQGRSFDEVKSLLDRSVALYVEESSRNDRETARRLLARTAPLSVRAGWGFTLLWHWLNRRKGGGRESLAGFDISCPA